MTALLEGIYGLYNRCLTNDEVIAAFEYKHGSRPEVIVDTGGGKLAGPISDKESDECGTSRPDSPH